MITEDCNKPDLGCDSYKKLSKTKIYSDIIQDLGKTKKNESFTETEQYKDHTWIFGSIDITEAPRQRSMLTLMNALFSEQLAG